MAQEGQIVRNRRTGEMGRVVNGQVVPLGQSSPTQGPVIAPPDPYKQAGAANDSTRTSIAVSQEQREASREPLEQQEIGLRIRKLEQEVADADPVQKQAKTAEALLTAAGVDLRTGKDPVADLIRGSTSGRLQNIAAGAYGAVTGDATDGMENIGKLQTIVSDMTLQLTGGSLGTQISNADREFIMQRVGNLADPNVPADQRLAAWEQVKQRMANLTGVEMSAPQAGAGGGDWDREKSFAMWGPHVTEDGGFLGPDGGYAKDLTTGEWGLHATVTDDSPDPYAQKVDARANLLDEKLGRYGAVDLAGHGLTLGLTDEAAGIGNVISEALQGNFSVGENYRFGRDVEQRRIDTARENTGAAGTVAEVLGGGALGKFGGGVNALMGVGRQVAARGAPVTRSAIQGQLARNAGREGAIVGGVGGFGYGRDEDSVTNALIGAAGGGVIGFGGQKIGNALANRGHGTGPQVSGAEIQQAADDLRIPVIPAVTGGTTSRSLTSGARQGFVSDRPIASAVERMENAGGAARNRAASQTGRALEDEDAGNVVRKAANVYSKRTSQIGGNLYDRADRKAGGITLPLPKAIATADKWLADLGQSTQGAKGRLFKDVKALRDSMAKGQFTVKGVRLTRTELREEIQERGLRGSTTDKVFGEILQSATEDLFDGLVAAGKPEAAAAIKTANAFWQKRVETIDEVLEPILGKNAPRSGEQIVTAIENLMKPKSGNAARLRQLMDSMPKDEARSVAATIITRMGQPTAGAAEKGSSFSFTTFLTNWNNMSPRARAAMFPAETREALDKLATVSVGVKRAGTAANTSNTARALVTQAAISTPLVWIADPLTVVAATAGQWTVGRLLASPRIARWIAGAPKQPNSAYIARLGGIARAEPAIANEVGLLQRTLTGANDNAATVTGAVADEQGNQPQQ